MTDKPEEGDIFDPQTTQAQEANLEAKAKSDAEYARNILETRKGAYTRVFVSGSPTKEDRRIVLEDLGTFCRFNTTTFDPDERVHVLLTGRQEAYLRIEDFTKLPVDTLVNKYAAVGD